MNQSTHLQAHTMNTTAEMERVATRVWKCTICGWVYDEAEGCPDEGIAGGTRWEDVPESWICPECGVGKNDFEMAQVLP